MDIHEKIDLIKRPPTEEIVTDDDLVKLFETNSSPKHYIGLEISGFLHLGSLISTGFKINDFVKAGVKCTIFLADWHTVINDKLGGSWDTISEVVQYYQAAFKLVCPSAEIVLGSKLYQDNTKYWSNLIEFAKHMSLARTMRTLTVMGRSESEKIDLAKLFYPPMQAVDIHSLDVDIAHAGMDQRKIHMLVREIFPKMKWKVPIAIHHGLLPGLVKNSSSDQQIEKMSKSDPNSGIFIHNTDDEIRRKINKAWCEEGNIQNNPLLAIAESIIFTKFNELHIERPEKFGGNITYTSFVDLKEDFTKKSLHPGDLKRAIGDSLVNIISPIRDNLHMSDNLISAINNN